jgi:hypothetical protein
MTETAADLVAVAMDYPFDRPDHSFLFVDGEAQALPDNGGSILDDVLLQNGAAPMHERTAVLAYGANAAPSRLKHKFSAQAQAAVFPVLNACLQGFDIVYACHFSGYGALPATPAPSSGTAVDIAVTYLDRDQLARMHETELPTQNYVFGRLGGLNLDVEGLGKLDAVHSYWSRHGAFARAGEPFALSAISAKRRGFAAVTQETAQSHARDHLAPGRDLHEFVAEQAVDPDIRKARSLALRAHARPCDHPHCEIVAR